MRSTRISAWVGIIAISLCVGTVLGVLSIAYLDQIEQTIPSFLDKGPLPGRTVHSIDYYHPQQA